MNSKVAASILTVFPRKRKKRDFLTLNKCYSRKYTKNVAQQMLLELFPSKLVDVRK